MKFARDYRTGETLLSLLTFIIYVKTLTRLAFTAQIVFG